MATPTELRTDATTQRGEREWRESGLLLTHGTGGWGHYGLPLPEGLSADVTAYLEASGSLAPL